MIRTVFLFGLFLSVVTYSLAKKNGTVVFFHERIQLVPNNDFFWLKEPVWSIEGSYLLLAMSKWTNDKNESCGMLWRYNDTTGTERRWKCSRQYATDCDADSEWEGDEELLVCQNGNTCQF